MRVVLIRITAPPPFTVQEFSPLSTALVGTELPIIGVELEDETLAIFEADWRTLQIAGKRVRLDACATVSELADVATRETSTPIRCYLVAIASILDVLQEYADRKTVARSLERRYRELLQTYGTGRTLYLKIEASCCAPVCVSS